MTVERDEAKNIIRLVTTSRQELFNLAALIARAIDPALLEDKNNPVLISVNGSECAGKKIFPDAMRRSMMSSTALTAFKGRKEYDELWYYHQGKRTVEIDFINTAWDEAGDYSKFFRQQGFYVGIGAPRTNRMLSLRKFGGITFVHNEHEFAEEKAGIRILVKDGYGGGSYAKSPLLNDAYIAEGDREWRRYVSIAVTDPRIATSKTFQQAAQEICKGGYKDSANYNLGADAKRDRKEFYVRMKDFLGVKTSVQKTLGI